MRWNSLFSVSEVLALVAEGEGGKGREVAEVLEGVGLGVKGLGVRGDGVGMELACAQLVLRP